MLDGVGVPIRPPSDDELLDADEVVVATQENVLLDGVEAANGITRKVSDARLRAYGGKVGEAIIDLRTGRWRALADAAVSLVEASGDINPEIAQVIIGSLAGLERQAVVIRSGLCRAEDARNGIGDPDNSPAVFVVPDQSGFSADIRFESQLPAD